MRLNRSVYRTAASSLLTFGMFVNSAIAGTGSCTTSASVCSQTCGRPAVGGTAGVPCYVRISESGSTAYVTAQSLVGIDTICVAPNTQLAWFTLEPSSNFSVTFGPQNPFGATTLPPFTGNQTQPPSGNPVGSVKGCFQYSITHSIGGSNASADPKVIVTSQVLEGKKHKKPKAPQPKAPQQ